MNLATEAQLLIEPAFFWFVIGGGIALILLAVVRLIELFSKEKMLFRKAALKREIDEALKDLE